MGSYDNGVYQPLFSVIAKNANVEQKEEFIRVIEDTLREIAEKGMVRRRSEQGSIITSSASARRILEIIRGD